MIRTNCLIFALFISLVTMTGCITSTATNTTRDTGTNNANKNTDIITYGIDGNANTVNSIDNTLYLTQIDGEYLLYLNQESYKPSEEGELYGQKIEPENQSGYQQEALLTLPGNSSIFSFMLNPNNQFASIVIQTRNMYHFLSRSSSGATGISRDLLTVFFYDISTKSITSAFSNIDLENNQKYILTNAVSNDKKIAFDLYGCWGCEPLHPTTILWNPETNKKKDVGQVSEFEWLEGDSYRYKEFITIDCPDAAQEIGECSIDSKELNWTTDSIE